MLGKVVAQYPNLLYAQTPFPVDALPPRRVVESMDTSNLEASGVQPFPASNHLPGQMPRLADAWATTRSLLDDLGDGTPNDFGFAILCTSQPCRTASATLYVGRSDLAVAGATSQLQDQESRLTMAAFGDDGALSGMLYLQREQKAPLPILPPASPPPAQPPAVAAASGPANGVWAAPPAAVTTGVGVIAALGGLLYWLWPVLKGAGVGLFSRIEPEELLRQPTRARIHAVIEAQPGIHFHALARASAVGNGALEHHLQKLEKGGLVLVKRATGYTCYFPKGTDRHVAAAAPAIRSDGSRAVLEAVARRPGASSRELAAELGVSPSTVSYHLRRLHQAGLVHAGSIGAQLTGLGQQAAGTGANAPTGATAAAA
jgi:hypothetical protein